MFKQQVVTNDILHRLQVIIIVLMHIEHKYYCVLKKYFSSINILILLQTSFSSSKGYYE